MSKTTRVRARVTARVRARVTTLVGVVALSGCFNNPGLEPPTEELNFPGPIKLADLTADATDAPTHLLVANTNFDLAYNGATLQSYDLAVLDANIVQSCLGLDDPARCAIVPEGARSGMEVDPGALTLVRVPGLLTSEVIIGSFADGITLSPDGRLAYLPSRGDADLTYVELDEGGGLRCGGEGRHRCDDAHRTIATELIDARDLELPNEPVDVIVGSLTELGRPASDGNYAMLLHRGGAVTFLTHGGAGTQPRAIDVLEEDANLGSGLATLTRDPASGLFYVARSSTTVVPRVGVALDAASPGLEDAQVIASPPVTVSGLASALVTVRQVLFDPRTVAPFEGRTYALLASPSALVVGRVNERNELAVEEIIDLGDQPSRADLFEIGGKTLIAVSCYASRDLYFVDADRLRVIGVIRGFSGAFEIAFDAPRERLYVSDYRVSVIRFVDLAPLVDCLLDRVPPSESRACSPRLVGMLGIPNAVQQL